MEMAKDQWIKYWLRKSGASDEQIERCAVSMQQRQKAPDIRICPDCKHGVLRKAGVCLRLCGYDEQEKRDERSR